MSRVSGVRDARVTYILAEELGQNPHQFIVNETGTFERGLLDALDLLLDDDLEGGGSNEESRRRSLANRRARFQRGPRTLVREIRN